MELALAQALSRDALMSVYRLLVSAMDVAIKEIVAVTSMPTGSTDPTRSRRNDEEEEAEDRNMEETT